MESTSRIAGTENRYPTDPIIISVKFINEGTGLFGDKVYEYFAAKYFDIKVGDWAKVLVNDITKNVYVVSIRDGATSKRPLKTFYGYYYDNDRKALNTKHAKAIAQLKIEDTMAFGASIHSQIDALCNDGSIIDYKTIQSIDDKLVEVLRDKTPPKESTVHPFKLITKTFVTSDEVGQDVDVSKLSDDQIFDLIAKTEAEITKLEAIKTKPKKLQQRIDDLKAGITQITAYLDAKA